MTLLLKQRVILSGAPGMVKWPARSRRNDPHVVTPGPKNHCDVFACQFPMSSPVSGILSLPAEYKS
jgi:hypothetical protein